jgi:hypothetical protein
MEQYTSVEEISPDKASSLLERNVRNRNLRMERVRELSGAMAARRVGSEWPDDQGLG